MSDTFPPAMEGQALLLKAHLTSHLFDREFPLSHIYSPHPHSRQPKELNIVK